MQLRSPQQPIKYITIHWTSVEKAAGKNKPGSKKNHDTKIGYINISDLTRRAFIKAIYVIIVIEGKYVVGDVSGPDFKIHWCGSR